MRLALMIATLALCALAAPAQAGDPETCRYLDPRLEEACLTDPAVREFLLQAENIGVEHYMDVPPAYRGWEPGEEAAVIALARGSRDGCDFQDRVLSTACRTNAEVRRRVAGGDRRLTLYHLPWELAGRAPNVFDPRQASADPEGSPRVVDWLMSRGAREDSAEEIERAIERRIGQNVTIVSLYVISINRRDLVACGYAFSDGGGYEVETSGPFVFDTRGGSAMRATPQMMRERCAYADAVLRIPG